MFTIFSIFFLLFISTVSTDHANKKPKTTENQATQSKQLLDIPDEVLEEIFSYLNFNSLKNISLCCKRLNGILSQPGCMDRIIICFDKDQDKSIEITRQYKYVMDMEFSIPPSAWTKLTNMTSYRFVFHNESNVPSTDTRYLIDMLPKFSLLSCLDIRKINLDVNTLKNVPNHESLQVMEMNHLKIIRINMKTLTLLNGRFIKIQNNQLKVIELVDRSGLEVAELNDVQALKTLIDSQCLKELRLEVSNINRLFDSPLILSSQLKKFVLISNFTRFVRLHRLNTVQQDNLCEFVFSQKHLEKRNIKIKIEDLRSPKMEQFLNSRLDLPLMHQIINFDEQKPSEINDEKFERERLPHSSETPSYSTKQLTIRASRNQEVLKLITSKFPNVVVFELSSFHRGNLSMLNNFQCLTSIDLMIFEKEESIVSTLNFSALKKCKLWFASMPSDFKYAKGFLNRHKSIEDLDVEMISRMDLKEYTKLKPHKMLSGLLEYAFNSLKNLRTSHIGVSIFSDKKSLRHNWDQECDVFTSTVTKFAKCGHVCTWDCKRRYKLTKTFDGSVIIDISKVY